MPSADLVVGGGAWANGSNRDLGVERSADGLRRLLSTLPEPAAAPSDPAPRLASLPARKAAERQTDPGPLLARLAAGGAALLRRESRGAHFRSDAPDTNPRWRGRIVWGLADTQPVFEEVHS